MKTETLVVLLSAGVLLAACPAGSTLPSPSYPEKTTLKLSTPRCSGGSCTCRSLDTNDNQAEERIPAGHKRFEFRLPRTTSAIWVEVKGQGVFYKPAERMNEACFYVDLPVDQTTRFVVHSVRSDKNIGLQTGLKVFEYGAKEGPHWYRVFEMTCGGMNRCTKKGMAAWVAFMRKLPRGLLNPCGSVKINNVSVSGTRERKIDVEYTDMTARFDLEVYTFETYKDPASAECGSPAKPR